MHAGSEIAGMRVCSHDLPVMLRDAFISRRAQDAIAAAALMRDADAILTHSDAHPP